MSISPPTDIILDVARAADPVRYQEAAERLRRIAVPGAAPSGFDDALKAAAPPRTVATAAPAEILDRPMGLMRAAADPSPPLKKPTSRATEAYQGFEAVALTTFIQEMLPQQATAVFGTGTAGEVWKSMMAEQIAGQMARAGGIGIAKHLAAAHPTVAALPTVAAHPAAAATKPPNGISQVGDIQDKAFAKLGIVSANQRSFVEKVASGGAVERRRKVEGV